MVMGSCGLAPTVFAAEPSVSGVERVVVTAEGGVVVEWTRTAGPRQLLGWHVERQLPGGGALRLTAARVEAGLFDSPATVYRFRDAGATARAGDGVAYRLVAVDPELREWPGEFTEQTVLAAEETPAVTPAVTFRRQAAPARLAAAAATVGSRVRIGVTNDGLYRLSAASIAAVLQGYDEAQVAEAILQTNLALSCGGAAVAWRAEAGGAALLFFGQAYRDTYTDRNVYWLEPGTGLAMGSTNRATAAVADDPWFWETVRAERDLYFMPYAPGGTADDYFVWSGQQLTSPSASWAWTTHVALADLHPAVKTGTVTAHLISAYDGAPVLDNRTRLTAAGQLLDDRLWAGDVRLAQSGTATNLGGASVPVTVELRRETNVTTTTVLIDALEVRYARRMRAQNDQLLFQPEAGTNTLTVRGFSNPAIRVFEVTDPLRPVEVAATVVQEGASDWRVSWTAAPAAAGRYLAVARTAGAERFEGVSAAGWSSPQAGASHVVIAPQAMTNAAAALVAYRQQQGLASLLVPLEDLYDAFAFGRRDPRAIPRFLAYAQTHWTVPPVYVCLAGDGHLDYLDHFGQATTRPNHVPPLQERIPYDASPSGVMVTLGLDNPLADTDGDGLPNLAIGRLPAQTPAALTAMINRIATHEAADDWKDRVLLISDKDADNAFGQASGRLAERVPPGMAVQRLDHTDNSAAGTAAMRTNFIQALNSGSALAVYFGHANNVGISSPYFFEHSYVRSYMSTLTNGARAPLFLAGTCMLNDFAAPHPDNRCLGKGFLDTAPGGTVAIWASAAEATLAMAELTASAIFDELFAGNDDRLGDLIRPALALQANSASPWTVRSSVLLGDPGTRIRTQLFLDHLPPAIQITAPTAEASYQTTANHLNLAGTAADAHGILGVVVRNDRLGGEQLATGTTHWQANGLELEAGTNWISAVAFDSAGNAATDSLQVVYVVGLKPWIAPSQMEVEDFNPGGQGRGYSDTTVTNEGRKYRPLEGVDISQSATAGNGHVVGWTKAGEWLEYTVNVETGGTYTLETRLAAKGTGGQFRILVNGVDKTGALTIPNTGTWTNFQVVRKSGVELAAGVQTVRVAMVTAGTSGSVGDFDWFRASREVRMAYPAGVPWTLPGTVELENYDIGGAGVSYNDATAANEGQKYRTTDGVDISQDATAGNGHVVGWTRAGEWLEYTVNVASGGTYTLEARLAANGTGGQFRILVNGVDKTGALGLPNTGSWAKFQVVQKTGVELAAGVQTVRVAMATAGTSGYVGVFDWIRLTPASGAVPGPVRMAYPAGVPWALPGTVELENYDIGGAGVAYNDATAANEGQKYRTTDGVDISQDATAGNGYVVGWTKAGEWLEYTVNVASGGTYTLEARLAAKGTGGQFRILVNGVDKTGALSLPNTGSWTKFQVVQKTGVELAAGVQTVRVAMATAGTSGYVGVFDWIRLTPASGAVPGPARMAYPAGVPWTLPGTVELENYDIGGAGVAYNDATAANEGQKYRTTDGVDISQDATAGNGHVVGWTKAGEWLEYTVNVASGGTYTLEARLAAKGTGGQFRILVNGVDKTGALSLPNTGSWTKFQVVQKTGVELAAGVQTVRVAMATAGTSGYLGVFDWIRVTAEATPRARALVPRRNLPEPSEVLASDEALQPAAGWLAVDGDAGTAWQEMTAAGGGWLVLAYAEPQVLHGLEIDWEPAAPAGVRLLGSLDAESWTEFELAEPPQELQYLWINFTVPAGEPSPAISEIRLW